MDTHTERRNRKTLVGLLVLVAGMVGLAYASVPLYALFCQVTGYGGTTQRAESAPGTVLEREITVQFNADVNNGLAGWSFRPNQRQVKVKLGETVLVSYRAENRSKEPLVGTAVFNVTPEKTGMYFSKIECFCFTEQLLQPGEAIDMPVAFFVDPALAENPNTEDVRTITLSYTFFRAKDGAASATKERTAARPGDAAAAN